MSEWYYSQQKPSTDFRKPLQERIKEGNPRQKKLTADEKKRLEKLEAIAERIRHGENIQNLQLQTWLSENEYT